MSVLPEIRYFFFSFSLSLYNSIRYFFTCSTLITPPLSLVDFPFVLITSIIAAWTVLKRKEWKTSIFLELTTTLPLSKNALYNFDTFSVKTRMEVLVFRLCAITTHQNTSKCHYIWITTNQKNIVYRHVTMVAFP